MLSSYVCHSFAIITYAAVAVTASSLPIVDLGYVIQQASLNNSGPVPLLSFSNIRFADPPTGPLRFEPPIVPQTVNRTVNDGQQAVTCPQANPTWIISAYLLANGGAPAAATSAASSTVISASSTSSLPTAAPTIPPPGPNVYEDCLFLDVILPEKIFNSTYAQSKRSNTANGTEKGELSSGAPVLVWLYGGGYVLGDKTGVNDPASLLAESAANDQEGLIFVAPNYRLGLFGWQGSTSFQAQGGTSNVGLLDQRLALEWVQKYIALFGGDPSRVTVIGESAGAGSIMHHITAPSNYDTSSLFNKAIAQSPGYTPSTNAQQTETFNRTLELASTFANTSVTTLTDLRQLPFEVLYDVNVALISTSDYGTFTFQPVVDGGYVPALPDQRLLNGSFDKNISTITSRNANEGKFLTDPEIQDNTAFQSVVQKFLPGANSETINYITTVLYPPVFNGSYPYLTQNERAQLLTGDFIINCHSSVLAQGFADAEAEGLGKAWKYTFAIPPGLHGADIAYTFFNGDTSTPNLGGGVVNATVAGVLQSIISNLAQTGKPDRLGVPPFPTYGDGKMFDLNSTMLGSVLTDPDNNERCTYWQEGSWLSG